MNKRTLHRLFSVLMALVMAVSLLTGCGTKNAENVEKQEDAQTIQVYLWTNNLYETYAPYIQSQLPDVNIEFIAGNNDLDFYKFLQENGGLPDIITCCRFSLHDAAPLKDSLMNLALTNEAGAVYNTYLNSFKNEDSSVNWLPVCADAHGFVVNRSLFEQYGIPLPTDYASFAAACQAFEDEGIDTIFLPFFSQNGEKWIMTTPYFQVALNRDLEQDTARREKAMKVLNVMLSEEAQNRIVADGQDVLSYSQNVPLRMTEYMKDVRDVVEENHMYIRIASNDFFAISKDVVSKMIAGEYTAQQAYRAFNAQLLAEETPADDEIVLTSGKSYSNVFHANGGSASFSVMANTLRGVYGTDVLLATANSFTGSVLQADYNKKMAASMIMPNGLMSRQRTMTGAELKETVRAFVEGCKGGFVPFNRGSLPVVSGIAVEVKEAGGSYTLTGITRNGQPLRDDDTVTVTCLAAEKQMEALLASESGTPLDGDTWVKNRWRDHVSGGGAALAEPENYITLR
jgi:ABC-type glycerol-3-phosphate transport system substrate-binding protein